jgi:hypothetical protein
MSHRRTALKTKAYVAYHREQRHVGKFGIDSFRVAIVTQTSARAQNLETEIHATMSTAQRRAYPIVALEELTPARLIGN